MSARPSRQWQGKPGLAMSRERGPMAEGGTSTPPRQMSARPIAPTATDSSSRIRASACIAS
eukprot:9254909-Alexandrium_andersonii.AAC.1